MKTTIFIGLLLLIALVPLSCHENAVRIGSKKFTESVILGEVLSELVRATDRPAIHYQELGGTRILFDALVNGDVDAYPEYTGTIDQELFAGQDLENREAQVPALKQKGISMSQPVGFNNTYAIGMLKARAEELGVESISDLSHHPELRLGFTNEFMERGDGWPALKAHYGLNHRNVQGLDHDIAYRQLESGSIDVIDVYSTDAKIKKLDLAILDDDFDFFPRYECVVLYRADLARRMPEVVDHFRSLEGKINESTMVEMNYRSETVPLPENLVAREFIAETLNVALAEQESTGTWVQRVAERTIEHLDLVRRSLIPAILLGIPMGIAAFRWRQAGRVILSVTGIIQTIPALALLVLVMPVVAGLGLPSLGTGSVTAVVALFLYSLLPIVMATYTGLSDIEPEYIQSGRALGLSTRYQLWNIELPLASRQILSGIKTAAVINVGFATLGALIGAGGYGQPILTGIRRAATLTILEGAIPAAVLAIAVQLAFEVSERWVIPRGLRLADES